MPLSTISGYEEESTRQCRELVGFWKRRQEIELEYGTALAELCQSYHQNAWEGMRPQQFLSVFNTQPTSDVSGDSIRAQLLSTSLWAAAFDAASQLNTLAEAQVQAAGQLQRSVIDPMLGHLREMKAVRKVHQEHGREITRQLQESYTECRRAKQEYDKAQAVASEIVDALSKAQLRAEKKKELEKLQAKAALAIEKVTAAEEYLRSCEEKRNSSQQAYFEVKIPEHFTDVHAHEQKRLELVRKGLSDVASIDCIDVNSRTAVLTGIQDMINSIDLRKDILVFEKHHLDKDTRDASQISVRTLIGAMKAGRTSIKRGDTSSGWTANYLVLMAEDMLLYCFDGEDSEHPREIISLAASQVYSLDDSYYGRAHCFQTILDTDMITSGTGAKLQSGLPPGARITYNFIAESANDKQEWIQCLREFGYCCKECAALYRNSNEEGTRPATRSLGLWVMEAKDLKVAASSTSKSLHPYCVVLFNDIKQARTGIRSEEAPFWGEEFRFNDIPPCQNRLRLLFFSRPASRLQKDLEVGYVSINLGKLKSDNRRCEDWHQIRPFLRGDVGLNPGPVGSVRIAYQLSNEESLPMPLYKELLETVTELPLACVQFIGDRLNKPHPREEFAKTILNILVAFDRDVAGVQVLTRNEIENTTDANILFRGNSIATKILDQYMKMVGGGYLHSTLQSLIRGVYTSKESCEVDPSRLVSGKESDQVKRNWKRLLNHATIFWEAIQRSAQNCPPELVAIFAHMIQAAEKKFDTKVKYAAVSGFIFLRFYCPAILNPKLFGIMNEHPPETTARTLTLLAKILQVLANMSEFEGKEPHMAPANNWIASHLSEMKMYIQKISTPVEGRPATPKPRVDLRRESAVLHKCITAIWSDLKPAIEAANPQTPQDAESGQGTPLQRLIPVMERLSAASEEQAQLTAALHAEMADDDNFQSVVNPLSMSGYDQEETPPLPDRPAAEYDDYSLYNPQGELAFSGISAKTNAKLTFNPGRGVALPLPSESDRPPLSPTNYDYAPNSLNDSHTLRSVPNSIKAGLNLRALAGGDSFAPHSMQEGILSNAIAAMDDSDQDEFHLAPMSPMGGYTEAAAGSWKSSRPLGGGITLGRKSVREREHSKSMSEDPPPQPSASIPLPSHRSGTSLNSLTSSPRDSPTMGRKEFAATSPQKATKTLLAKSAKVGATLKNMLSGQASVGPRATWTKSGSRSNPDSLPEVGEIEREPSKSSSRPRNIFGSVRKKTGFPGEMGSIDSLTAKSVASFPSAT
ncbi:Ras GTPase-activating protein 1 [Geranomyces variabilis]|uniref:Ras GTPase-activating protein 1 n=1 Tax=Geranomyces variabilis TaxID=109894 RepID=A0AAD5TK81_9FUNG|nr:Ras GTPase-activating protein 1 [Geranomyces variabilis]